MKIDIGRCPSEFEQRFIKEFDLLISQTKNEIKDI